MLNIYVASETDLKVGTTMQVVEIGEKEIRDGVVVRRISLAAQSDKCPHCQHGLIVLQDKSIIDCIACGGTGTRR